MNQGMNKALSDQIRREQSKHPMKPKGCNGWWHPTEKVLLHGAGRCPVCEARS